MVVQFAIPAAQFRIPNGWKVNWDHVSQGRMLHPEIRFESLLCLSLAPDFVLDFGWCLRDEGFRFDLQINRGHFGLSDVVFYEGWYSVDPAIETLQLWLDRLTADSSAQAVDHDLQIRLASIERRIRHYYIPPAGEAVEEPLVRFLRRLILKEPASYWEAGSGDAAIHYRNRYGVVLSQLIFMLREPHGVHLEFHGPEGPALRCVRKGRNSRSTQVVSTVLGGAPWDLPANQFVSRRTAAQIVAAFITEGTGDHPGTGLWVSG
jgi:hypothetical protein